MWCFLVFFFFKQKTAYEMRISDWSSDVCSSDLDLWILPVDVEHVGVVAHPADAALDAQLVVAHGVGLVGGPGRVLGEVAGGRRAVGAAAAVAFGHGGVELVVGAEEPRHVADRKSTRLNSSH